jgi:hypothetical protein
MSVLPGGFSLILMIKTFTVPALTKLVLGGGVAGLIGIASLGAGAAPVLAASTSGAAAPQAAKPHKIDNRQDRRQVARVLLDSEAAVLGISPAELRTDLKKGGSVSDLAQQKGITKEQFADRLATAAKPGLDKLVDSNAITAGQEQAVLNSIRAGHLPHWDRHAPKPKA